MSQSNLHTDRVGQTAANLTIFEVGLGSILHGFRIPFSGHFLSLNQIFWLTRLGRQTRSSHSTFIASQVVAALKSLAPAGKKLTPMLAISMQGVLFSIGSAIGASSWIGHVLGALLSALWAFLQPLFIYLIIYGSTLIDVAQYYLEKINEVISVSNDTLVAVISIIILIKSILALVAVFLAYRLKDSVIDSYLFKISSKVNVQHTQKSTNISPVLGALKDLMHPFFVISFVMTLLFLLFAESDRSKIVWLSLRPVAVAYVLFFLLRAMNLKNWVQNKRNKEPTVFTNALDRAIAALEKL